MSLFVSKSIDISKPLLREIQTKIKDSNMWILLSYESLSLFCFNCGTIGHFIKSYMETDRDGVKFLQYGSKIKATPLRRTQNSIPEIITLTLIQPKPNPTLSQNPAL